MEVKFDVKKILVPVDFSDPSRKAFYVALKMATLFGAETYVLHIQEPIRGLDKGEEMEKRLQEATRLEEGVRRRVNELFEEGGLSEVDRRKVHVVIGTGKPYLEIVRYAYHNEVDLIVMGSHGYSGVKQMFFGSQTEKVMRLAPCAVLIVKPDDIEMDSDIIDVPRKFDLDV